MPDSYTYEESGSSDYYYDPNSAWHSTRLPDYDLDGQNVAARSDIAQSTRDHDGSPDPDGPEYPWPECPYGARQLDYAWASGTGQASEVFPAQEFSYPQGDTQPYVWPGTTGPLHQEISAEVLQYELDAGTAPSYPSFSAASRTYPTWDVARSVAQTPQHPALDVATSESIENAYHHHQIPGWNVPHMGAEYIEDAEDDIGVDYQGDEDYDFTTAFGSDLLSSYANDAVSYSMYFPPVPSADNSTLGTYTYTHPENNLSPYPQWPQPATSSPVPNQTETTNPDTDATPTRTRPRPPLRPPSPSSGPSNDTSLNANAPTSPPRLNRNPRGPPYSCPNPTCASTTQFARHADLMRHAQTVHRRDGALLLDCPRRNCVRRGANGFSRRDHLREHLRAWHMVDIPKRGTRSRGVVGGGRGRGRGRWV